MTSIQNRRSTALTRTFTAGRKHFQRAALVALTASQILASDVGKTTRLRSPVQDGKEYLIISAERYTGPLASTSRASEAEELPDSYFGLAMNDRYRAFFRGIDSGERYTVHVTVL